MLMGDYGGVVGPAVNRWGRWLRARWDWRKRDHGKREGVLAVGVSVIEKPVGSVNDERFGVEGRAL